jgi:hypothetical protein
MVDRTGQGVEGDLVDRASSLCGQANASMTPRNLLIVKRMVSPEVFEPASAAEGHAA